MRHGHTLVWTTWTSRSFLSPFLFLSLSLLLGLYMLGRCGSVERPARTDNRMDHMLAFRNGRTSSAAFRACPLFLQLRARLCKRSMVRQKAVVAV
jgi:hypothetical protein